MGNILFEHNRKAYEAAILLMQETGRAAVIHPTGTGKSFIAFKLCADNKNKKICWLSPSEYIYRTQEEKWLSAGGDKCQNIRFFTYAKLIRMGEEEIPVQSFDYIILDEFHRLGAAQWGAGVERLWAKYPDARVLGLSATNIRYLDNQRDMAWELFGGNIASELTLGEAVARGILPAPKYVLSIYSYRKELEKYQTRIRHSKNRAVRDAAQKELEALRRALDKADGLSEVFARHMPPVDMVGQNRRNNAVDGQKQDVVAEEFDYNPENRGRYIVFCANYNHLNEMKALAGEWFAKVDPTPHIYTAYSDDPGSAREFEEFKKDESAHLKLLYCIDMLNEGIHVDGLDGVILLRPTVSPIIYKQQIGRALAAGGRKAPLIFDIVMNIENLCSIGAVEEELGETVLCHRASGCKDEIVQTHFNVVDEVGDCRKLFRQLNETLGASWEAMYALAKDYYLEHGNLLAPAHYSTASGYSLGAWLATQRKVYLGKVSGNLSVGQVKRLESIGMVWEGKGGVAWEEGYAAARGYYLRHGNLAVPAAYETADGFRLGRWVRRQREVHREILQRGDTSYFPDGGDMEGDGNSRVQTGFREPGEAGDIPDGALDARLGRYAKRFKRLEEIGMVWENGDSWEYRFHLAEEYYKKHGDLDMPADYIVEGVWLGRWLREQRGCLAGEESTGNLNKLKKSLNAGQKEKLISIGLTPEQSRKELSWRQQYGEAEEFYREHGNLCIPKRYIAGNGKNLGIWLQRQRTGHRRGQLAGWQVLMLEKIGMVWETGNPWETGYCHAKEYFEEHGHLAVPNQYICADGYRLGKWISNQRFAYGAGKKEFGQEKIQKLENIGMIWKDKKGRSAKRADFCADG